MHIHFDGPETVLVHLDEFRVSVEGVVVNVQFAVDAVNLVFVVRGPWIDLQLEQVQPHEHLVQVVQLLAGFLVQRLQLQLVDNVLDVLLSQPLVRLDLLHQNVLGVD